MENKWTLHVRELGKIQEADITAAPLTLFVGDNNSGKSYLMAVLYALLNIQFTEYRYDMCKETEEYASCMSWIEKQFEACEPDVERIVDFSPEVRKPFEVLLNKVLGENLSKLSQDAFNTDVSIGSLEIMFPDIKNQRLRFKFSSGNRRPYEIQPYVGKMPYSWTQMTSFKKNPFMIGFILEFLIKAEWKKKLTKSAFLPTSRTGFLLTYKSLVRASISDAYDVYDLDDVEVRPEPQQLTRPCSDFLKNLAELSVENESNRYNSVIRFIESRMVCGHISLQDNTPQSSIYYKPDAADLNLPMHLVSGVVTELTPLLLMLKYSKSWQVLFMEEPEIGLHPALQAEMARVFVKMRNSGIPLFITTHSDTILQGLNNFIKFSHLPEERRKEISQQHDYDPKDRLLENDVAMYQFDVDPSTGRSRSQKLTYTEYGFLVPTFNDALSDLLEETRELEKDDE